MLVNTCPWELTLLACGVLGLVTLICGLRQGAPLHPEREAMSTTAVGQTQQMTVLFLDVCHFSQLVSSQEPSRVVDQMNAFFSVMVQVVEAHGGRVDSLVGDQMLAFFDGPGEEAALRSVTATLAMRQALETLNVAWQGCGRPIMDIRVGLHTGAVTRAAVGSGVQKPVTLVGETVNVAARLQALNKLCKTSVLLSEQTRACLGDRFPVERLGTYALRGQPAPVEVYALRTRGVSPAPGSPMLWFPHPSRMAVAPNPSLAAQGAG